MSTQQQELTTKQKFERLQEVIEQWKGKDGSLMPVMHEAQGLFGCLDEQVQIYIAENLGAHLTDIFGVATFYSRFTLEPKGKYCMGMCLGTACYVRGAQDIYDEFQKQLGIASGETSKDKMFTLEPLRCIGCCGLAPAMSINEEVYGRLTKADVPTLIAKFKELG